MSAWEQEQVCRGIRALEEIAKQLKIANRIQLVQLRTQPLDKEVYDGAKKAVDEIEADINE